MAWEGPVGWSFTVQAEEARLDPCTGFGTQARSDSYRKGMDGRSVGLIVLDKREGVGNLCTE